VEAERYSVNNCALEAKFMRESGGSGGGGKMKAAVDNTSERESEKAEVAAAPAI
jgi:hypothetical protein